MLEAEAGVDPDMSTAPLPLKLVSGTSFPGEKVDIEVQLCASIVVRGAGDARANGIYVRAGTQNAAPRGAGVVDRGRKEAILRVVDPLRGVGGPHR